MSTTVPAKPSFSEAATLPELTPEYMGKYYPSYLELIQAQVFFRHGERTPIVTRFSSQAQWAFCGRANLLYSEFMKAIGQFVPRHETMPSPNPDIIASGHDDPRYTKRTATLKSGIEYEPAAWSVRLTQDAQKTADGNSSGSDAVAAAENSWEPMTCDMGQLTDIGLDSLFRTGSFLRSLYVDKLNFLPSTPEGKVSDYVYVRTTDYSRVIQSTHALLVGLYPGHPQSASTDKWTIFNKEFLSMFPIFTRRHHFETMHGNFGCYEFIRNFINATVEPARQLKWIDDLYKQTVALKSIGAQAKDILSEPAFGSNFHKIYDELVAMKGHGMDVPDDISQDFLNRLGEASHYQWANVVNYTKDQRLGFGRLVNDVVSTMTQAVNGRQQPWYKGWGAIPLGPQRTGDLLIGPGGLSEVSGSDIPRVPKLALYGGHDVTVGPLSTIMGNQSEEWVPFASMLTFELFKDRDDGGKYVRIKMNDRVLQVPTCEIPGKHHAKMGSTMCTFDAFMEHVQPLLATEDDYKNECGEYPKGAERTEL